MTATWVSVLAAFLHLLAVAVYVGGSVAMEAILGPAQRYVPPAQAQVLAQRSADRFLVLVWSSLALLPASGMLLFFSLSDQKLVTGGGIFTTGSGRTLLAMMALWAVLVVNGALITFVYRPRLTTKASGRAGGAAVGAQLQTMQQAATWVSRLTRIDLAVALVVVLLGASLAYGNGIL
ncbi:MAG: CopD family protein [Actinomycetota bacterium]|nr:CopD family protein [Actinomycetota bacterium]